MSSTHSLPRVSRVLSAACLGMILTSAAYGSDSVPAPSPVAKVSAPQRLSIEASPPTLVGMGLPQYQPPASFSEDLVVNAKGKKMVMTRSVDQGKTRLDMKFDGGEMTLIDMGDEKATFYTLMPRDKRAMKQSRAGQEAMMRDHKPTPEKDNTANPPEGYKIEDLGDEAVAGVAVKKVRFVTKEGDVLAWFDKATGAPVRMESMAEGEKATMEWTNRKVGPPPAALFEVPKGYEVTDMDEMKAKMKGMGGMGAMAKGMAGGIVEET